MTQCNGPPLPVIAEDTSSFQMDTNITETFPSRTKRFHSGSLAIIEDGMMLKSNASPTPRRKLKNRRSIHPSGKHNPYFQVGHSRREFIVKASTKSVNVRNTAVSQPLSPGRWSTGISGDETQKRVMNKLASALAKDLSLSMNTLRPDILPLPEHRASIRRASTSMLPRDPRHDLIRPERIPSVESLRSNSVDSLHSNSLNKDLASDQNFRLERNPALISKTPNRD
jgi:hypothetical protein